MSYARRLDHHTPEHPTPWVMTLNTIQSLSIRRNIQRRIWKVSHMPETDNLFFPHAGTSNAACGKSNNCGRYLHSVIIQLLSTTPHNQVLPQHTSTTQLHQPRPCAATPTGSARVCKVNSGDGKTPPRAHPSYPRFYSRSGSLHSTTGRSNSGGNWREFHFEIRPKPRFSNRFSRQQIGPNLCNSQLELEKWMRNHTSPVGISGRRREIEYLKIQTKTDLKFVFSGDLAAADGWRWTRERRRGLVGRFGPGLEAGLGL
ncbi:hypothetical protein L3X38_018223 [Prunus dulcis]|uniref:Uncharacterized protein n=1 Tax=Prunus dulcis TaxID=3755 RepID=A0AAD4W9B7_PRUDU|nr:hypothetical protein L3X38_018223 [Prunus dulcis]